jgi:hypothetical protein
MKPEIIIVILIIIILHLLLNKKKEGLNIGSILNINPYNRIFQDYIDNGTLPDIFKIKLFGVGADNKLYKKYELDKEWIPVGGDNIQIIAVRQLHNGTLIGVGKDQRLYTKLLNKLDGEWTKMAGDTCCLTGFDIVYSPKGNEFENGIFGIGTDQNIYLRNPFNTGRYIRTLGSCCIKDIKVIDIGSKVRVVTATGTDNKLFISPYPHTPIKSCDWKKISDAKNTIEIMGLDLLSPKKLIAIGKDNKLYTGDIKYTLNESATSTLSDIDFSGWTAIEDNNTTGMIRICVNNIKHEQDKSETKNDKTITRKSSMTVYNEITGKVKPIFNSIREETNDITKDPGYFSEFQIDKNNIPNIIDYFRIKLFGVGSDNKLYKKYSINDGWTPVGGDNIEIIAIRQLIDGKLIAIGKDRQLYVKDMSKLSDNWQKLGLKAGGSLIGVDFRYTPLADNKPIQLKKDNITISTYLYENNLLGIGTDNLIYTLNSLTTSPAYEKQVGSGSIRDIKSIDKGTNTQVIVGTGTDNRLYISAFPHTTAKKCDWQKIADNKNTIEVMGLDLLEPKKLIGIGKDNKLYTGDIKYTLNEGTTSTLSNIDFSGWTSVDNNTRGIIRICVNQLNFSTSIKEEPKDNKILQKKELLYYNNTLGKDKPLVSFVKEELINSAVITPSSQTGSPAGSPAGAPAGSPAGSPAGAPAGAPAGSPSSAPSGDNKQKIEEKSSGISGGQIALFILFIISVCAFGGFFFLYR